MFQFKRFGVFLALFMALSAKGSEYFLMSAVGALNLSNPSITSNGAAVAHSGRSVFGLGVLGSFPILPLFRIETGVIYLPHSYSIGPVDTTFKNFHVPILVRIVPLPFISLGLGGYLGFATGSVSQYNESTKTTQEFTYETLNWGKTDFGLAMSVGLDLPVAPATSLLVDMRYLIGLSNLDKNATKTLKTSGWVAVVGLKFGI